MSSDSRKLAMMMSIVERGHTEAFAMRATLALMPLDDAFQPGRAFEKGARKLARQHARATRRIDGDQVDQLATETLRAIKTLASQHGEAYYTTRYDQALSNL
jgi:hypothetical protein